MFGPDIENVPLGASPMSEREPGRLQMALGGQDKALMHLAEVVNQTRDRLRPVTRSTDP